MECNQDIARQMPQPGQSISNMISSLSESGLTFEQRSIEHNIREY